jgi:hypothetical protein
MFLTVFLAITPPPESRFTMPMTPPNHLGTSKRTAADPRGGFKSKPDFTVIRQVDGEAVNDSDQDGIDRNEYDPYA